MSADLETEQISAIHHSGIQLVIAVTGGGSGVISRLLSVPGGSRSLLEAVVPYAPKALSQWLGREPDNYCSEEAALAMAARAFQRAEEIGGEGRGDREPGTGDSAALGTVSNPISRLVGVGITAALVSDRPKKGEHRCFVATQAVDRTTLKTVSLKKQARSRLEEEQLSAELALQAIAGASGVSWPTPCWLPEDRLFVEETTASPPFVKLRQRTIPFVCRLPTGELLTKLPLPPPSGLLSGSFHPLHQGHILLRAAAERCLQAPVWYELTLVNADKPPLDFLSLDRRCRTMTDHPLLLTCAPTFAEKAKLFPGTTFVVGFDTATRILDRRFYAATDGVSQALQRIREQGCRFLVAARKQHGRLQTLSEIPLPREFSKLFEELPANEFSLDISSTALRKQSAYPPPQI